MPILVAVRDLMFRSKIQEAAARAGVEIRFAPRDRPLADAIRDLGAGTVLADLNEPGALDALRAGAAASGVRAIGWLGHLQQDLMDEASAAGVEVLTRGQLVARLDGILRGAG
jgi:hypothetical protein